MPKALQKRGRRMKRKCEDEADDPTMEGSSKRRKPIDDGITQESMPVEVKDEDMFGAYPESAERVFFGMLDEEEQEYFKRADEMLELNSFANSEERTLFIESVYREADGKELKIAHSQSCSRLMERLIRVSTASQLKKLFQKFSGNFIHLLAHRFASHCCESLFTYAAPHVSDEVLVKQEDRKDYTGVDDIYVSMENLFLHTLAELEGNWGFLLTDRYASHALRILLLILSGEPISTESMKSVLQSKKKEGVIITGVSKDNNESARKKRAVPKSFSTALEKLIADSVAGLDTDKLRAVSKHPNASPTLQLLLTLELTHFGKSRGKDERSIIRTLLPDDPLTADTQSAAFISDLVYDSVGSHLVEKIIEHAPAKLFKMMYNNFFKERMASYARNEQGTYIDCRIIERLGYDDLLEAHEILCPIIPTLLGMNWTSLTRTLIERCTVRNIDTQAIAVQIDQTYRVNDAFDIAKMLKIASKSDTNDQAPQANGNEDLSATADKTAGFFAGPNESSKVHFNILAQAMLIVPGSLSALILDSLINLESAILVNMAHDHIITRTLQQALTTKNASMIERRKLIQRFYGNIGEMALDTAASHVVDCIWEGTHGLAFIRERIAEELAENEAALRESPSGRAVWRNWKMDLYKRRRSDWVRQSNVKASNDGFQSFSELDTKKESNSKKKTPLQLARERHAAAKIKKEKENKDKDQAGGRQPGRNAAGPSRRAPAATGANAISNSS